MSKKYSEKLKDPRWQKKRLEVLERDRWCCQSCHNKDATLHAHHTYYEKNLDPWEYPDFTIVTLCEDCHKAEHAFNAFCLSEDIKNFNKKGVTFLEVSSLIYDLESLIQDRESFIRLATCIENKAKDNEYLK